MTNLQRLEGFFWVARTGGFAKAVRAFPYPITEPGIHQQVRKLQGELGVSLLVRVAKDQMAMTPEGRALYDFIAPFFEQLPGFTQRLMARTFGGELRIHAGAVVLRHLLPPWLRRLGVKRPDIEIVLTETKRPELELLRLGASDLIVDYVPNLPPGFEARQVALARGFLVVPSAHAPKARTVTPRALSGQCFIGYSHELYHRAIQDRALAGLGISPGRTLSADSSETILSFIAAGLGFSLLPSLVPGGPRSRDVRAYPLTRPAWEFPVSAVWRSGLSHPLVEAALAVAPTI